MALVIAARVLLLDLVATCLCRRATFRTGRQSTTICIAISRPRRVRCFAVSVSEPVGGEGGLSAPHQLRVYFVGCC